VNGYLRDIVKTDLLLVHAPSVYDFRNEIIMHGPVADVHGAGATLAQTAAEPWAVEAELISEHIQQRRVVAGLDVKSLSVDLDGHPPCPIFLMYPEAYLNAGVNVSRRPIPTRGVRWRQVRFSYES